MATISTTTVTDQSHLVSYFDAGGIARTVTRSIETRIFLPDTPGTYDVVLYSHGLGGSPFANSANIAAALADLGYIVIAPTHLDSLRTRSDVQDDFGTISAATALHRIADMQFLLTNTSNLVSQISGYTADVSDPTIAGHSMGAFTSQLLTGVKSELPDLKHLAAGNPYGINNIADARFGQTLLLSPQGATGASGNFGLIDSSWDTHVAPSLGITGTLDYGSDNQTYSDRMDGLDFGPATGKYAIVITGADHLQIGGATTLPSALTETIAAADLFLDAYVQNDAAALAALADPLAYLAQHENLTAAFAKPAEPMYFADGFGGFNGTSGNDFMDGRSTHDLLRGFDGADTLVGNDGWDTLEGGQGNDILSGGAGTDVFRYRGSGNMGVDVIADFDAISASDSVSTRAACTGRAGTIAQQNSIGQDRIDLAGLGYNSGSLGSTITISTSQQNTVITFVSGSIAGTQLTLMGVNAAAISGSDFIF